ncbi:MAG: FRG domain-containing protein [Bacteroides sp.]|nr:FRG domain-containing protein [Bacteroides sp.]
MNGGKSEEALRCIEVYKKAVQHIGMSFDKVLDFEMIMLEVEANCRLGRNAEALQLCDTLLAKELTHAERARVLLVKGSIESDDNQQVFCVNAISEALGEAEADGSPKFIGRCYLELAKMLGTHYPALSLSLLWKARIIYEKDKDVEMVAFCKERMAMSYFLLWHRTDDERYKNEALRLVNEDLKREVFRHSGAKAAFDRLRGVINNDLVSIKSALDFFEEIHAWGEAMRTAEFYIKTALTIDDREKAKEGAKWYEEYAEELHDESRLAYIRSLDLDNVVASWIPQIEPKPLPDLLDVLDWLALDEEWFHLEKTDFRLLFPTHYQEGKFEAIMMPDGRARLYPLGLVPYRYYRGQSDKLEGKTCVPSLYRGLTDAQMFYERLCLMELEILLSDYPLTAMYLDGLEYNAPDGKHPLPLMVDVEALGQHYGINTDLLDVTADKWVAAFFASTKCDNGKYLPFTEEGEGVMYVYNHLPYISYAEERLSAVGQQPFSRPGAQAGLVYKMLPGEDFNSKAQRIVFKHNPKISEFVFNYCNRSKRLFPQEILENKVSDIRKSNTHSRQALEMVKERYYKDVPEEVIQEYLKEKALMIQETCLVLFSDEEKRECLERWKTEKGNILDTIQVRLTYTEPIVKVEGEN